uniref:Uncharacterized protein n=1 Tax=viral metagenome TaxID=1070528 RepID=A0A6M3K801_9ZZZZ
MINPNRETSEDVLRRLKEASYERMRIELKNSIEMLMEDFGMTWNDVGRLLGMRGIEKNPMWEKYAKQNIIEEGMTLEELNDIAHIFSCDPYVIFRPRFPWTRT